MSIQVSLNGLSFSIVDSIAQKTEHLKTIRFKASATPYLLLKELKKAFEKHSILKEQYEEVTVVHKNNLYALVPHALFDVEELPNYLKFNTKLLANDEIAYDMIPNQEVVCVYVPFTNINNYLFDCFGEFEFKHHSQAILQTLFHQKSNKTICYVHVDDRCMELTVLENKKLLLYNQFEYKTKEDFLYYVLFTYEQLGLDVEEVKLKMFGKIEEDHPIFDLCHEYIKKVSVFIPKYRNYRLEVDGEATIDLTLLGN